MPRKTIEITDNKAVRIEPVKISGKRYISVRQLYRTTKNPNWMHGRQGINIDADDAPRIAKIIERYATLDESEYTDVDLDAEKDGDEKPARTVRKRGDK